MRRIVLGLDGSDGATAALRWAIHEAVVHDASLEALFAWSPTGRSADTHDVQLRAADTALREWLARMPTGVPVIPSVRDDTPASALVDASVHADLVVVGSRGLGGFRELLLGSVSAVVAERALCPVAVVRETSHHPAGPVVVGVDGSAHGQAALQWAAAEARARDVALEVVHAWSSAPVPIVGVPADLPSSAIEESAGDQLAESTASIDVDGLTVHRHLVESTPAGALVRSSERAAAVVVGSRGRSGLTAILLGSTSRHLLHHAHCPVVVVR